MTHQKLERVALVAARPSPVLGFVSDENRSDNIQITTTLQVAALTRRCSISIAMAKIVASLLFGEVRS
jgi:hypothetical protein